MNEISISQNILNFSIFGKVNSGKCSLNKAINLFIKDLSHPKDFTYNNTKYHLFPIPCCGPDLKDNFDISIKNSDFILIAIDSTTINNINSDFNYYLHLISLSIINGIKKLIFVFTKKLIDEEKKVDEKDLEKIKNYISDIYLNIKNKFGFNKEIKFDYVLIDSLDGEGIEDLLNKFPNNSELINEKQNKDNNLILFGVFDKYSDKEREEFVLTCKACSECSNSEDTKYIKINETKLNCFYLDDKNLSLKKITDLIPFKLSLADGEYIEKLEIVQNQFLSLKFKLNLIDENLKNNVFRNIFLSLKENEENICLLDTFEADIIVTSFEDDEQLKNKSFTVLTKGCTCLFCNYNSNVECTIVGISGEYEKNKELVKKKIINCKNGVFAKIIINLSRPILSTKFDFCEKFGSFTLVKGEIIFALGKIVRYKPKK